MVTWRLIAHHSHPRETLDDFLQNGYIALGWNCTGDLAGQSEAQIKSTIKASGNPNWPFAAKQLLALRDEMQPGDLVIVRAKGAKPIVMRISSDYEYKHSGSHHDRIYDHRRAAEPVAIDPDELWTNSGGCAPGWNPRQALVRCAK